MNLVQQAIIESAAIEVEIKKQIDGLEEEITGLKQTRDASRLKTEMIIALFNKLNQANSDIETAVIATKKEQDNRLFSSCCNKVTSFLTCSNGRGKTVRLIGMHMIIFAASNASPVHTFFYPKEETDVSTSAVSIIGNCVAGIFTGIMWYNNKLNEQADLAAKDAVEKHRKKQSEKERQKEYIEALAQFKITLDTPALKRCITTRRVLENTVREDLEVRIDEGEHKVKHEAELSKISEVAVGLIHAMPKNNECRQLIDEIASHAKQNLDGSPKQSTGRPPIPRTRTTSSDLNNSEQDEKASFELETTRQFSEPFNPEPVQIKESELEEYSKKWERLEALVEIPLGKNVVIEQDEVSFNRQGQCWKSQTPKQKDSDDTIDNDIDPFNSDPSLHSRYVATRVETPYRKGGSPPSTTSSIRLTEASGRRTSLGRPATPVGGVNIQGLTLNPSNSSILGMAKAVNEEAVIIVTEQSDDSEQELLERK